jgi:hypothetical protein
MSELLRIYDNTEVSGHRSCNRKHFFRHEMHLDRDGTAPALANGLAWHKACDVIWTEMPNLSTKRQLDETIELAKLAYRAWEDCWAEEGYPREIEMDKEWETKLRARTPQTAIEMIMSYIVERFDLIKFQYKLVAVEQPFIVPLDPADTGLWYSGRIDKVIERTEGPNSGKRYIVDHKSTSAYSKAHGFLPSFTESFSPNGQVDGYAYGAKMLYGDDFGGVYIDGALVHKIHHDIFCFLPVSRSQDQMDAWLWECREEIRRIEADRKVLDIAWEESSGTPSCNSGVLNLSYLPAAPKNTGSCYNFNSPCMYMDLCKSWGNPLRGIIEHGTPAGYIINEWSPFSDEQQEEVASLIKDFHHVEG